VVDPRSPVTAEAEGSAALKAGISNRRPLATLRRKNESQSLAIYRGCSKNLTRGARRRVKAHLRAGIESGSGRALLRYGLSDVDEVVGDHLEASPPLHAGLAVVSAVVEATPDVARILS
jgi:hypothetical protein